MGTPIKLTLYDPKTQEPLREVSQSLITFGMLVKASQLKELMEDLPKTKRKWWWIWPAWMDPKVSEEEQQTQALLELVAEFFNHQVTVEELRDHCDVAEVIAVLRAIMSRAGNITQGNPTLPAGKTKTRR